MLGNMKVIFFKPRCTSVHTNHAFPKRTLESSAFVVSPSYRRQDFGIKDLEFGSEMREVNNENMEKLLNFKPIT